MFWNKDNKEKKQQEILRKQKMYDRVYALHEQAEFLCYIDDAYKEEYNGELFIKLEGLVAKGTGTCSDTFVLYDYAGRKKGEIMMEELYLGNEKVEQLECGDKKIALYPKQQDINYCAGDILCKIVQPIEQ